MSMKTGLPPAPSRSTLAMTWGIAFKPTDFFDRCAAQLGDIFTIRLFNYPPIVMCSHPAQVKAVFTDRSDTMNGGKFNSNLRSFLGDNSVIVLQGKQHQQRRQLLLPSFHGERMRSYGQAIQDIADSEIDHWPLHESMPLLHHMELITVRIILRCIFGVEDKAREMELAKLITDWFSLASWGPLIFPMMQFDWGMLSPWGRFLRKTEGLDKALYQLIRERREELSRTGGKEKTDVLSLLMQARDAEGRGLSDQELRDELVTLIIAGHDTSATSLTWIVRWLWQSESDLQRLIEALRGVGEGGEAGAEQITRLELLDSAIREALRLQPIFPFVGRVLEAECELDGWRLPAGTAVCVCSHLAQRRPDIYPEPNTFKVDRFVDKKFDPFEYFPFGGGNRRCIGLAFAMYEMKIVMARVLSRVSLRLDSRYPYNPVRRGGTVSPNNGLRVIVEARA